MPITTHSIRQFKKQGKKIVALTAYDYPTAKLLDKAGVDIILVGDSLGQVVLGYESTIQVTMEDMLHHARAVIRGTENAFIVVDLPFLSYQVSIEEAINNAGSCLKVGANAVKVEGASTDIIKTIKKMTDIGIPVMGHIGFTPQSVNQLGGNKVQAKDAKRAVELMNEAKQLEEAGCFALVLEMIPSEIATLITNQINIPTIGIGAGLNCDGQILVTDDLLGRFADFKPKFVKRYADINKISEEAIRGYIRDVHEGSFPSDEESFFMQLGELEKINYSIE